MIKCQEETEQDLGAKAQKQAVVWAPAMEEKAGVLEEEKETNK